MQTTYDLTNEWQRLFILANCLAIVRQGESISDSMHKSLIESQEQVLHGRQASEWQRFVHEYDLSILDQDILACAIAPNAEPRLGWLYQQLQAGNMTPFPSPAFMHELYFMGADDTAPLYSRLHQESPLLKYGLLKRSNNDQYMPVKPTDLANTLLLGWKDTVAQTPPGTVRIEEDVCWDDVVLPEYCIKAIKDYLLWITHKDKVINEWGGKSTGGPVALFSGPSGTGKTYSAQLIAHALGWPLYRVDLGLLVSKYIGETEKNLNKLFDAAHNKPMVLLFDEADSLFGKRGDVKDVRDRFANMEISHLLSRIEQHQGPCILTTNLHQNIDHAFTRRFQVVIEFSRPDAHSRSLIWQKHLPPRAPYKDDIDFDLLGSELDMTGGQIRNTALHAAYLAAGDNEAIGIEYIALAVRSEMGKTGKEVTLSSLGQFAKYLQDDE